LQRRIITEGLLKKKSRSNIGLPEKTVHFIGKKVSWNVTKHLSSKPYFIITYVSILFAGSWSCRYMRTTSAGLLESYVISNT
jgi:hypothetical protein